MKAQPAAAKRGEPDQRNVPRIQVYGVGTLLGLIHVFGPRTSSPNNAGAKS